jgi:microcystin degradation protein MlrC
VMRGVRELLGDRLVIGTSTDLHGYISARYAALADVICGYQTYPHTDFRETGVRTARAVLDLLVPGTPDRVLAWVPVPMIVSASAYDTLRGAFAEIVADGHELVRSGVVRDFTVYQMQPWLDVAEPNSAVVVIADDESVARRQAERLAQRLWEARHGFVTELASIDAVIDLAADPAVPKPVVLVDSADSTNAGAPGDSMAVADRLLQRGAALRCATVVSDPAGVAAAHRAGVGAVIDLELGGGIDPRAVRIAARGTVRSLHDGTFRPETVGHTGDLVRVGRAAVISFGGLDVMVCEHIAGNGDPRLYRAFGIEPTMYDLVVVKANTSFRAAYARIAGTIVATDTPGAASSVLPRLPYARTPATIHPWSDAEWQPRSRLARGHDEG